MLSVLDDKGFTLPTEECKRGLELASFLSELCHQAPPSSCSHTKLLVDKLNKLFDIAKNKGFRLINEEKLWNTYQKLRISAIFEQELKNFLDKHKLTREHLLHQHIADKAFDLLI